MKLQIFSIYDSKAEAFLPPFTCANVAIAQRTVHDCLQDAAHPFSKNTEDYTLFHLGAFNETEGYLEPLAIAASLGNLETYK